MAWSSTPRRAARQASRCWAIWRISTLRGVSDPATLGARYAIAAVPGLSVDTTLSYVGNRATDAQNSGLAPGHALWDAGISYDTRWGTAPTTLRLHAKNLADEYYYAGVYYSGGLEVGRGREVFLSAKLSF